MAIDLCTEKVVSFRDAVATVLPARGGKTIHVSTLHRWRCRGLRGVQLDALKIGGGWFTSREALQRFFTALSQGSNPATIGATAEPTDHSRGNVNQLLRH